MRLDDVPQPIDTNAPLVQEGDPERTLLRKLLTDGYADLKRHGRRRTILVDTSWIEITQEEANAAELIWEEEDDEA